MFAVGSDRAGGGERRQSVAKTQKAHVLFTTNVGRPQSVGVAPQSDGINDSMTDLRILTVYRM